MTRPARCCRPRRRAPPCCRHPRQLGLLLPSSSAWASCPRARGEEPSLDVLVKVARHRVEQLADALALYSWFQSAVGVPASARISSKALRFGGQTARLQDSTSLLALLLVSRAAARAPRRRQPHRPPRPRRPPQRDPVAGRGRELVHLARADEEETHDGGDGSGGCLSACHSRPDQHTRGGAADEQLDEVVAVDGRKQLKASTKSLFSNLTSSALMMLGSAPSPA